jgi:LacI family transcriptional regulator
MKYITIEELARHLYLSKSTVSRALRNAKDVNSFTKERVLYAAEQLGYKTVSSVVGLKPEIKTIGFIVSKIISPFFTKVLRGVCNVLYPLGYKLIILESDHNQERERENLLHLEAFNVDGIIISIYSDYNLYTCQGIVKRGTPVILFGKKQSNRSESSFPIANDYIAASLTIENLINSGRKRIACIMGPNELRKTSELARGYDRILEKHQINNPELLIETEGELLSDGEFAINKLFEANIKFDSIFVLTSWMALGAASYLQSKNIDIVKEVKIFSYSGENFTSSNFIRSEHREPLQEPSKIGETAAEIVLEKIKDNLDPNNIISFYPGFIDMRPSEHHELCAGIEYLHFSQKKEKKKIVTRTSFIFD